MRAASLVILLGCSSGTATTSSPPPRTNPWPNGCPSERPQGSAAEYTAPELRGVAIGAPQDCTPRFAFISVDRASGKRKLATARPTPKEACLKLPADPAAADCPLIHPGAIVLAAYEEATKRGLSINGWGMIPCGPPPDRYNELAPEVHHWKDAEQLVRIVGELMERYDVEGHSGASVSGIPCVVLQ